MSERSEQFNSKGLKYLNEKDYIKKGFHMKKILVTMCCLLPLVILCSCGDANTLVGRWNGTKIDGKGGINECTYSLEFYEDGSVFLFQDKTNGDRYKSHSGTYTIIDDNKLKIDYPTFGTELYNFTLNGDSLILSGDSFEDTYTKNTGK